ncbi:MAG: hypothetical protein MOB07_16065 [Acidobacteria bacterium]|nr:hypothetical protein [Acidobacteriota bacterium]
MGGIKSGTCVFLTKPAAKAIPHLWIVLTDPEGDPPQVVMVNLNTKRDGSDTTVVLHPGEHRFIKHETVVNYSDARFVEVGNLQALIAMHRDWQDDDCSDDLLAKIRQGLIDSPFTPNKIKTYCQARF